MRGKQTRTYLAIASTCVGAFVLAAGCGDDSRSSTTPATGSVTSEPSTSGSSPAEGPAKSLDEAQQRFLDAAKAVAPDARVDPPTVGTIDTPHGPADAAVWESFEPYAFVMAELAGEPDGEATGNVVTVFGVRYEIPSSGADAAALGLVNVIDPQLASDDDFIDAYLEFTRVNIENAGASTFFTGIGDQSRTLYVEIDGSYSYGSPNSVIALSGPFTTEAEAASYVNNVMDDFNYLWESQFDCCGDWSDISSDATMSSS